MKPCACSKEVHDSQDRTVAITYDTNCPLCHGKPPVFGAVEPKSGAARWNAIAKAAVGDWMDKGYLAPEDKAASPLPMTTGVAGSLVEALEAARITDEESRATVRREMWVDLASGQSWTDMTFTATVAATRFCPERGTRGRHEIALTDIVVDGAPRVVEWLYPELPIWDGRPLTVDDRVRFRVRQEAGVAATILAMERIGVVHRPSIPIGIAQTSGKKDELVTVAVPPAVRLPAVPAIRLPDLARDPGLIVPDGAREAEIEDPITPFRALLEAARLPAAIEAVKAEWKRKHPAGEVSWDMRRGGAELPVGLYLQFTFRLGPWPPVYAWLRPDADEEQVTEAIETAWRWMASSIASAWKPEVRR